MMNVDEENLGGSGRILVADDEAQNRQLLRDILEAQGFEIVDAIDGADALDKVGQHSFDAILLDVMMPGQDGFQVCRQLKADPETARIPVLLVTALTERKDRLEGISAGANDYISKPFDTRYVPLRVRNAVRSKRLYDRLQENYHALESLEELRDNLSKMIVHDMRSALVGVSGNLELLELTSSEKLDDTETTCLQNAITSSSYLVKMTNQMLDISRLESNSMPVNPSLSAMHGLVTEAIETLGSAGHCVEMTVNVPQKAEVWCDPELVARILANLLGNAVKYVPIEGGKIVVELQGDDNFYRVSIEDNGPGIPERHRSAIFEKFRQIEDPARQRKLSTGLGLTFCKLAVESHGGEIGVDSELGGGSTFWFTLPCDGTQGARPAQ